MHRGSIHGHGLLCDGIPVELGDSPGSPGSTHRAGPLRIAGDGIDCIGEGMFERLGFGRVIRHEEPSDPIDDDLGDATDCTCDNGTFAGHGLQIHDAEWFVDRWTCEDARMGEELYQCLLWNGLLDPDHVRSTPTGTQVRNGIGRLRTDFGCIGSSCAQHHLQIGIESFRRVNQVQDALLVRDTSDEQDVRPCRIDPVRVQCLLAGIWSVCAGIDAVMHDVDPAGIDTWILPHDVIAHSLTHCDDSGRLLIRAALNPAGNPIPGTELVGLPWAKWFK